MADEVREKAAEVQQVPSIVALEVMYAPGQPRSEDPMAQRGYVGLKLCFELVEGADWEAGVEEVLGKAGDAIMLRIAQEHSE